jgi:bifunctional non-homologous end joining protein LigD
VRSIETSETREQLAPIHRPDAPQAQWEYEVKWDGYRMQAIKHSGKVWLFSRNGADYTNRFPGVAQAVSRLKPTTLHMDGELVAIDREGRPSFQTLQGRSRLPPGWQVSYYAFDVLQVGQDCLLKTALSERRARLQDVVDASAVRFSSTLEGSADQVIKAVRDQRLEGVARTVKLSPAGRNPPMRNVPTCFSGILTHDPLRLPGS